MTKKEIIELLEDVAIELAMCNGASAEVKSSLDYLLDYLENTRVKVIEV